MDGRPPSGDGSGVFPFPEIMLPVLHFLARRQPSIPAPVRGLTEDPAEFLTKHADIVEALGQRMSLRCIEKATGKSRNTVLKVKRMTQDTLFPDSGKP